MKHILRPPLATERLLPGPDGLVRIALKKPEVLDLFQQLAYAATYRYATSSGNIKPSPDDKTLKADMTSVNPALAAAASGFGVEVGKQDQPARTAKAPR